MLLSFLNLSAQITEVVTETTARGIIENISYSFSVETKNQINSVSTLAINILLTLKEKESGKIWGNNFSDMLSLKFIKGSKQFDDFLEVLLRVKAHSENSSSSQRTFKSYDSSSYPYELDLSANPTVILRKLPWVQDAGYRLGNTEVSVTYNALKQLLDKLLLL